MHNYYSKYMAIRGHNSIIQYEKREFHTIIRSERYIISFFNLTYSIYLFVTSRTNSKEQVKNKYFLLYKHLKSNFHTNLPKKSSDTKKELKNNYKT